MSNPYVPLLILLALGFGFALLSVGTSLVVGPKRYNRAKLDSYECGIEPTPQRRSAAAAFPVKYYLTAMLFIIFDIEIVFLYPWAVALRRSSASSASSRWCSSSLTVFVAYAYVWQRGGLEWD